uniref:Uncharacterized protein n=1 Tax=Populus alba TaxID=43335 RepID=A0A4U5QNT6_POPAL|nr:hypothetical protein D5086_0000062630 [Populus alba]
MEYSDFSRFQGFKVVGVFVLNGKFKGLRNIIIWQFLSNYVASSKSREFKSKCQLFNGIAKRTVSTVGLDTCGEMSLLIPSVYFMQMFKVPTIQFRCHRSGFCQNQATVSLQ